MLHQAVGHGNICFSWDSGGCPCVRPSVSPFISPSKIPFHLATVVVSHPFSSVLCAFIISCLLVTVEHSIHLETKPLPRSVFVQHRLCIVLSTITLNKLCLLMIIILMPLSLTRASPSIFKNMVKCSRGINKLTVNTTM